MYEHPGQPGPAGPLTRPDRRYDQAYRSPSGLFPTGPMRPTYREPHPVRGVAVAAGLTGAAFWMLVFGLLGQELLGYAWWTISAGLLAWLVAVLLTRRGDRGVAVGIAVATAFALSIATTAIGVRWAVGADWPLW